MRELIRHILNEYILFEEQKPKGFWTDEELQKTVSKFDNLSDFKKNYPSAYTTIKKKGLTHLLDNLIRKKPGGIKYWTKEKVIETAKQFENLKDFEEAFPGAVSNARKDGYIEDLKKFLKHSKRNYWTLEKVIEIAKKYETIKDFRTENSQAYEISTYNGWLDELKKYLRSARGEDWTLEKVKEVASKYSSLKDFYTYDKGAYYAAIKHGWFDEVTKDMIRIGNLVKRAVYAFEFPDKSVYVGLTYNLGLREKQHLADEGYSAVSKHIKKTNLSPLFKKISEDYLDAQDALNLEICTIEKYRNEGWNILNIRKGGELGFACSRIYTFEKVKEEASKYKSVGEFKKNALEYYRAAIRNGWFDEITSNMDRKARKKITKDQVKDVALRYTTLADFEREQPSFYSAARRNDWMDTISHLKRKQKKRGDIIFIPKDSDS
jgi:predicted GIY-YIG superfamily endonuclease